MWFVSISEKKKLFGEQKYKKSELKIFHKKNLYENEALIKIRMVLVWKKSKMTAI